MCHGQRLFSLGARTSSYLYPQPMILILTSTGIFTCYSLELMWVILPQLSLMDITASSPTRASLMGWRLCWRSVMLILQGLADTPFAAVELHTFTLWEEQACKSKHLETGQRLHSWGIFISHWKIGGHHSCWCQRGFQQPMQTITDRLLQLNTTISGYVDISDSIYPQIIFALFQDNHTRLAAWGRADWQTSEEPSSSSTPSFWLSAFFTPTGQTNRKRNLGLLVLGCLGWGVFTQLRFFP